eukprot:1105420-Amorphochlora_amoeboformis.AAC.1
MERYGKRERETKTNLTKGKRKDSWGRGAKEQKEEKKVKKKEERERKGMKVRISQKNHKKITYHTGFLPAWCCPKHPQNWNLVYPSITPEGRIRLRIP